LAELSVDQTPLSALVRWSVAVVSVGAAFLFNEIIPQGIFPAPFFIAAVMISKHVGGPGPGLLSFLLASAILDYYYVPPYHSFAIRRELVPSLVQFIVPCAIGAWFIHKRKQVERLLERETAVTRLLQGEQSVSQLGTSVLQYLAPVLGAPVGAFYSVERDGSARRRATFAIDLEKAPERIPPGQGALGQVAKEGSPRILDVPPDYLDAHSSLGTGRAKSVALVPASDGERTHAVLELAFFKSVDAETERLLARISEPLAIATRTASYRSELKDLYEETQRQAEELRTHEEELRVANEELEERGRMMQETQRKLLDQQVELEQTNQTLQSQARLLEQQNEELEQAQEIARVRSLEAERSSRSKSEFLANMSHELRTPLNSSLILAKLLMEDRDGTLSAEQVRFAETIYSAGNDLLVMIDDLLDLAKIEAGKLELHPEVLPVARVTEQIARTFEPVALERKLHFEVRIGANAPDSLGTDAQRLLQILKNLLSNAFKFTDQGQVTLEVSGDAERIRFAVRDTGIGIAADQLDAIFEAFHQADGASNRKYGGTGLGLSISRDLARMLGGELTVSSTPGHGSLFTLALPRALPSPRVDSPSVPVERPIPAALPLAPPRDAAKDPAPARRTILVIEDDPRFAAIVTDLIGELDFRPVVAATADEAIALANQHPPDGIVLDMKLPDHSGLSVLDRLKRNPRTRHVPVHVISIAEHTRAALEMGAIGYLRKPVEREQIKAALQKLEGKFARQVRRLLVVEDDIPQREAICQLLAADGVEIVAVGTMREALERLRALELDCVVTDLVLPDGSGYDLLRTMANDDAYSYPAVVVYTGKSLSAEEEQRLRQYSSSIIVKGARSPERLLDEVTLFLHQVESTLPPERQRMLKKARNREALFEDRKILVVEDDVRNVFALTNVLEPKGMKVTIARNGREALEALELDPQLELVLMDIMMPEMDGFQAIRAIRDQRKWAKLPIIALTAKAMKDDQERCLAAGANDYIAKPLDVDLLLSLLRVWIPK
jgi:signal transduction histidine kinase/CheY-like chemotaxis protein